MQASGHDGGGSAIERVEHQLTVLVRRAQRVHLRTEGSQRPLERSAYSILGWLYDEGPLRPGALAAGLHLDASTVSRQVAALEHGSLVARVSDPRDGRACRLELTDHGRQVLEETREARRGVMRDLLAPWPESDQRVFADLLEQFNRGLDNVLATDDSSWAGVTAGVSARSAGAVTANERAAQ
jgi:DNA-binding MarR family transcriptional regulator